MGAPESLVDIVRQGLREMDAACPFFHDRDGTARDDTGAIVNDTIHTTFRATLRRVVEAMPCGCPLISGTYQTSHAEGCQKSAALALLKEGR